MSNDISNIPAQPIAPQHDSTGARHPTGAPPAGGAAEPTAGDRVTLTARGAERRESVDAARRGDIVDPAKVAAAREAIDSGAYRIDAETIADRLIDTDRQLFGRA